MSEVWKDINEYEGVYMVSNWGRVKSTQYHNGTYERIIKPRIKNKGYMEVGLYKDSKRKVCLVHRLVAQAFIPNPDNLPQVNHKDENKTNNNVENLEWATPKENNNYGTRNERVSKAMTNGKLSKKVFQYSLNGELVKEYPSTMEVERQLGYSQGNISQCCLGRFKTAYGYIWRYAD